jgi:diguanylate cyclase (GGDEF)-like protein
LVFVGLLGSFVGARFYAAQRSEQTHRHFVDTSEAIASSLRVAILHEQDLIDSMESLIIGNPNASTAQFNSWASAVQLFRRYSSVIEVGVIHYVPRADLATFEREQSIRQNAPFHLSPPGNRPYYCFATVGLARKGATAAPKDFDVCATSIGSPVTRARTSGKSAVLPFFYDGVKVFGLETPFYRGGGVPSTVAKRDAEFLYVVGVLFDPATILNAALIHHPNFALVLHYGGRDSPIIFQSGTVPNVGSVAYVSLHDGWTLEADAPTARQGLFQSGGALLLLAGGGALTLAVGALIFLLGTGRARSMQLVRDRTRQLQHQALHDSLTGLPNRALILDRIDQLLERNRRSDTRGAVFFVDLDDFKDVNDSLGHGAGDQLLVLVAWRMKSVLRGADTIGRMGGDEFVILIDGSGVDSGPDVVAQRLLDVMRQPFILKGSRIPIYVNTSIGIAVGDRPSGGDLLRDADVALYEAKGAGKNQYVFFDSTMASATERRITLEFDLRSAMTEGQFRLVYQPIYRVADLTIIGVEALLRWQHPVGGMIEPDSFISILERTGKIREVGAWVLREACAQLWAWRKAGYDITMSVNVSSRQFDSDLIVKQIRDATRSGGFENNLVIEITETALMLDVEATIRRLGTIKGMGVRVAIDDFGTGYCSLSYLRQLPVDVIKIDQSFIATLATSQESAALVKTFIQLSQDLGFKTVAEGVETFEQLDILRDGGVDNVQGFLFSRPLAANALEAQILQSMERSGSAQERRTERPPTTTPLA